MGCFFIRWVVFISIGILRTAPHFLADRDAARGQHFPLSLNSGLGRNTNRLENRHVSTVVHGDKAAEVRGAEGTSLVGDKETSSSSLRFGTDALPAVTANFSTWNQFKTVIKPRLEGLANFRSQFLSALNGVRGAILNGGDGRVAAEPVYTTLSLRDLRTLAIVMCIEVVGLPILTFVVVVFAAERNVHRCDDDAESQQKSCVFERQVCRTEDYSVANDYDAANGAVNKGSGNKADIPKPNRRKVADKTNCGVHVLERRERSRSCTLLLVGSLFSIFGFVIVSLIGLVRFVYRLDVNVRIRPTAGNLGYFPSTVSELVSRPVSLAGRCFFVFEFCAAFLIFMSWYPFVLEKTLSGVASYSPWWCCGMSLATVRQFFPPVGLFMLSAVSCNARTILVMQVADWISTVLHCGGFVLLFATHFFSEAHVVGWLCIPPVETPSTVEGLNEVDAQVIPLPIETRARALLLHTMFIWMVVFALTQCALLAVSRGFISICCDDEWESALGKGSGTPIAVQTLHRPASELLLVIKVLSYVSECIAGSALVAGHLLIWYFSRARDGAFADNTCETAVPRDVRKTGCDENGLAAP